MELQTLPLVQVVVLVVIAAVIGIIIGRTTKKNVEQVEIKTELEKTKTELNQHRQELTDHFSNSAELLENIYRDYSKLCKIMAKTSTDLLPEQAEQDNPFAKRLAHALATAPAAQEKNTIEMPEVPRDHSETVSSILADEKQEVEIEIKAEEPVIILADNKEVKQEKKIANEKEAIEKVE